MVGRRWWMKRQISDGREGEVEVKRSGSLRKEGFHFGISCFRALAEGIIMDLGFCNPEKPFLSFSFDCGHWTQTVA